MEKGKLYLFTSYTPGAGKTYRMITCAKENTDDLMIGFLFESHRSTDEAIEKMGVKKPLRKSYSISQILEDNPKAVVMDEIGMYSRNRDIIKGMTRKNNLVKTDFKDGKEHFVYEDVDILLDNGIDVYASVNLKRFESANPIFSEITGIRVKKKIPDEYLEKAEKIYFVDREPELMEKDFKDNKLFTKKYMSNKIMRRNFLIETLEEYRKVSLEYVKQYGDKVIVEQRIYSKEK